MKRLLHRLTRNEQGIALLEFIVVFPFMFILVFGAIEATRYVIIIQKVEKASYMMTDAIGQLLPATSGNKPNEADLQEVQTIANTYNSHIWPYNFAPSMSVIFTSVVHKSSGANRVRWQFSIVNGPGVTSITGFGPTNLLRRTLASCPTAPFDADTNAELATALPDENIIVGEVFYMYRPFLSSLLTGVTSQTNMTPTFSLAQKLLVRRTFIHPRNGDLVDLPNPPSQPLIITAAPCFP